MGKKLGQKMIGAEKAKHSRIFRRISKGLVASLVISSGFIFPTVTQAAPSGSKIFWMATASPSTNNQVWSANIETDGSVKPADISIAETVTSAALPVHRSIATDGVNLFFSDGTNLVKSNLDGSNSSTLVAGVSGPGEIVVSQGFVYYSVWGSGIWRISISGGAPANILTSAAGSGWDGVAVSGSTLYAVNYTDGLYMATISGASPVINKTLNSDSTVKNAGIMRLLAIGNSLFAGGAAAQKIYYTNSVGSVLSTWGVLHTAASGSSVGSMTNIGNTIYYVSGTAIGSIRTDNTNDTLLSRVDQFSSAWQIAAPPTFSVTYDGNGNTAGTAPLDINGPYVPGQTATVLAPSGLAKSGFNFLGWQISGTGTIYASGSSITITSTDITLIAKWGVPPTLQSLTPTSGSTSGGTSVTLTGTGFVTGATVKFGNTLATSSTIDSSTAITAVTPALAAGTVDVTVINPDSETSTLTSSFTFETRYSLTYDGNGSTSGTVPVDLSSPQLAGETITVSTNSGNLARTNYRFLNWNTQADGRGTNYYDGSTFTFNANTVLYAKWIGGPLTFHSTQSGAPTTSLAFPDQVSGQTETMTVWVRNVGAALDMGNLGTGSLEVSKIGGTCPISSASALATYTGVGTDCTLIFSWTAVSSDLSTSVTIADGIIDTVQLTGHVLSPARIPTFDTPVSIQSGFTVNLTNWDSNWTWNPSASVGTISIGSPTGAKLPVTISGLSSGQSSTLTEQSTRSGFLSGASSIVGVALINAPQPTRVPDPIQTAAIISVTPTTGSLEGGHVLIKGSFPTPIVLVQINGTTLPRESWTQTSTGITVMMPAHTVGAVIIQLYNGQIPILPGQAFTYVKTTEVSPTPTPTPTPKPSATPTPTPTPKPSTTPTPKPTATTTLTPQVKAKPLTSVMKLKVYFDMASSKVDGKDLLKLQALGSKLHGLGTSITIKVTGYAQPTLGSEKTDAALSASRASEVTKLLRRMGVNTKIIFTSGGRTALNIPSSRYVEIIAQNR